MADGREEVHSGADRRKSELGFRMGLVMCVMLKEESDSVPDDSVRIGLVPNRGERRTLSHVWAHLLRRVMRELVLRQSDPVPLPAYLTRKKMSAAGQGGRPRANRAVDWNRRPPAEVVGTAEWIPSLASPTKRSSAGAEIDLVVEPRGPLRRPDCQLIDGCIRRCLVRCCAGDSMIVSDRPRVLDLRESSLLSLRFGISYCYEFDESSVAADGFGFRDDGPEGEEMVDLVRRDPVVPPVRLVRETHELV